jgi:peptide/nickel transport system permease protein
MAGIVARKLGGLLLTLFISSFLVFSSIHLVPGDPISFLVQGRGVSPELLASLRAQYGLDQPWMLQYVTWVSHVLRGDLGTSIAFHDSVASLIASRVPTTLGLLAMSALIIVAGGTLAGGLAALRKGHATDRIVLLTLSGFAAVPPFVAALVLVFVFAVQLRWFPALGRGDGFLDTVHHLVLPAVALALTFVALVGRITRESMIEQLDREHVEVAVSRGMPWPGIIRRHVFRNALGPISTVAGLVVAGLLVSSSVIESAFGLSGVGSLLVQAVSRKDFPVVQAIVLLVVAAFVIVNAVVDLLAPLIDPRIAAKGAVR